MCKKCDNQKTFAFHNETIVEDEAEIFSCYKCGNDIEEAEKFYVNGDNYCKDCFNDVILHCENCETSFNSEEESYNEFEGEIYCQSCSDDKLVSCNCGDIVHIDNANYFDGSYYCEDCYNDSIGYCEGCDNNFYRDDLYYSENDGVDYCEGCYTDNRYFDSKPLDLSNNTFELIKDKRRFGIELEIDDDSLPYDDIEYNTVFGCVEDGSLSCGAEFVSPILQGDIGYNETKKLCRYLKNCNVGRQAGYHLHLDANDLSFKDIKKIWLLYSCIEPVIYGLFPLNRIENSYCRRVSKEIKKIQNCKSFDDIADLWYNGNESEGKYDCTRYHGLNLHAYFYQKTIEVRYHTGTKNFNKVINWVKFHQFLFDYAINHTEKQILKLGKYVNSGEILTNKHKAISILRLIKIDMDFIVYYLGRFEKFLGEKLKLKERLKVEERENLERCFNLYQCGLYNEEENRSFSFNDGRENITVRLS